MESDDEVTDSLHVAGLLQVVEIEKTLVVNPVKKMMNSKLVKVMSTDSSPNPISEPIKNFCASLPIYPFIIPVVADFTTHLNIKDPLKEHNLVRITLIACLYCKRDISYFCVTCHFYRGNTWKHFPICESTTRGTCFNEHVQEMKI